MKKDAIMQAFKEQQVDVLVSTTVIEVGVNVPNAQPVNGHYDADRSLSVSFTQLRGRGWSGKQATALFIANLRQIVASSVRQTTNGFRLRKKI